MRRFVVVHKIYETTGDPGSNKYVVVEHRFYGATQADAVAVFEAHLRTDSFLRGCETTGKFDGISCRTECAIEEVEVT